MMHEPSDVPTMIAARDVGVTRSARDRGLAKLTPLHRQVVESMPNSDQQEIRVLEAMLLPGDTTPRHTHRHPVTVCVTEGVFTLELDDREPVEVAAGQIYVEPASIPMTGCNKGSEPTRMYLFYVCLPDEPFAEAVT